MLLEHQNNGNVTIRNVEGFCETGHVIEIIDAKGKTKYVVSKIDLNDDAILELFGMKSNNTAIHDSSIKPKSYRSTYNSKHGRVW